MPFDKTSASTEYSSEYRKGQNEKDAEWRSEIKTRRIVVTYALVALFTWAHMHEGASEGRYDANGPLPVVVALVAPLYWAGKGSLLGYRWAFGEREKPCYRLQPGGGSLC